MRRLYNFNEVIGNSTAVKFIRNSLEKDRLQNFTIFEGIYGTGKSTCAEITGLYLTCDSVSKSNGNPCGICNSCVSNINALKTKGIGRNLIKKNLGRVNTNKDVDELIKEIFEYQTAVGNVVYILEEAHCLSEHHQTALLEEIDRLSSNVYVIICTTAREKLLKELVSRAFSYHFSRLNKQESLLLIDKTLGNSKDKISSKIKNTIISKGEGIPRNMIKLLEFVNDNNPNEVEINELFGKIQRFELDELVLSANTSTADMLGSLGALKDKYNAHIIMQEFKDYIWNIYIYLEGGIKEDLDKSTMKIAKDVFNRKSLNTLVKKLSSIESRKLSNSDLNFIFIDIMQIILNKNIKDILIDDKRNASRQKVEARETKIIKENLDIEDGMKMEKLDLNAIKERVNASN